MEGRAKGGRIREAWTGVFQKQSQTENSLAVQWLGLCAFTAQGTGSITGWRTETAWPKKKKKKPQTEIVTLPAFSPLPLVPLPPVILSFHPSHSNSHT